MAAPSESTVWTAVVSRTAGSTAPACDPAAPPHAATPTTRTASVAVPSPRCSVVIPPLSRREKIAENAVRRVQDRKSRAPWRLGLGQGGPHEPRRPGFLPRRQQIGRAHV